MVVDTSALLAIALDEPERQPFLDAIDNDPIRLISAASVLENKGSSIIRQLFRERRHPDQCSVVLGLSAELPKLGRDDGRAGVDVDHSTGRTGSIGG